MKKTLIGISAILAYSVPLSVLAQAPVFSNPANSSSIAQFISDLLKSAVTLSLPIIAVYIIYSGFLFVFAGGNQEQLSKAKTNFIWVIFGSALILSAWMLAQVMNNTVSKITGNSDGTSAARNVFNGK